MDIGIVVAVLCLCVVFYAWTTRRGSRARDRRLRGGSDAGAGTGGYVYTEHYDGQRDAGSTGGDSDCGGNAGGGDAGGCDGGGGDGGGGD